MHIQGQIGLRPEKIRTGKQLKRIDDVVLDILQKNDYKVLDRGISFHTEMTGCSMSYNEFLDSYQSLQFDDFKYTLKCENFSVVISKKPFCHLALCLEVDGDASNLFDVACILARIDHRTLAWKETDLMSERDYRERSEKKNRRMTFFSAIIGAALGASVTVLITQILANLAATN